MTPKITNDGYAQQIMALDGQGINFTKIVIGNGEVPSKYRLLKNLVNPLEDIQIESLETKNEYAILTAIFSNNNTQASFEWTEVGIFCSNPDSTPEEPLDDILYAYGHYKLDEDETEGAAYIPARGTEALEVKLTYRIYIGDLDNITATVADSTEYATKKDLKDHTNETNPHNTTAADVGLGNVPNVKTEDQTPDFLDSELTTMINIKPKERLYVILTKAHDFFRRFIAHFGDSIRHISSTERTSWNNKSDKDHKHSATDITSGTLQVARGGTGQSTLAKNAVITGNGTDKVNTVTGVGAFYKQNNADPPAFGTLPIAMGGTGKNSSSAYNADLLSRMTSQGFPLYKAGTYTGNGSNSAVTLSFSYNPKLIIICRSSNLNDGQDLRKGGFLIGVKGNTGVGGSTWFHDVKFTWNVNSVSFRVGISVDSTSAAAQYECNTNGIEYTYIAFF